VNSEDFFAFAYPALIILGVLISLIPAYIASKKNKSFWLWWVSTASIFTILLLVLIKEQATSFIVYLLVILPIASILALLPRLSYKITLPQVSTIWGAIKSNSVYWCLFVLILAGILYYYLLPHKWDYQRWGDQFYPAILAFVFLLACLGYVLFIFILSEKRKGDVFNGFLVTFLLSTPVLLNPSLAFSVLEIRNLINPGIDLGSVIASLMSKPLGGIFILFGICSAPAAALILFNDKYGVVNVIASILRSDDYSPPYIHFSKIPSTPILMFCILYLIFFRVFFHPTEGWMFLLPLVWLCFFLPTFLLTLAGTILSSVAIGMAINQKKNLYALGIFLGGLLAIWRGYQNPIDLPVMLLVYYGMGSGLIALILWAISDFRGQSKIDGV
jgi:hypothetical protein